MKKLAVDTCIFSYVFKGDSRANSFREILNTCEPCLSFMSVAELYRWTVVRGWGAKQIAALKREVEGYTVLDFDDATAWHWAHVMSISGMPISVADAWIAASALRHNLPLITSNRKHFNNVPGLNLVP